MIYIKITCCFMQQIFSTITIYVALSTIQSTIGETIHSFQLYVVFYHYIDCISVVHPSQTQSQCILCSQIAANGKMVNSENVACYTSKHKVDNIRIKDVEKWQIYHFYTSIIRFVFAGYIVTYVINSFEMQLQSHLYSYICYQFI